MVLKRGRFGAFMACPGYSEDPPCKTTRKLTQKQQQKAPVPLDENCPKCGCNWCCATASMESSSPAAAIRNASTSSRTSSRE